MIEQRTEIWSRCEMDYPATQLKKFIDEQCVHGWFVHQLLPVRNTITETTCTVLTCVVVLHRQKEKHRTGPM